MRVIMLCMSRSTPCSGALPARSAAAATASLVAFNCCSKRLMVLLPRLPSLPLLPVDVTCCRCWGEGEGEDARCLGDGDDCSRSCPDTTISRESVSEVASSSLPCSSWPRDCFSTFLLRPCREILRAWLDPGLGDGDWLSCCCWVCFMGESLLSTLPARLSAALALRPA